MGKSHRVGKAWGRLGVPRRSLALCAAIALLAPYLGAVPDIPFGQWHSIFGRISWEFGPLGFMVGVLFFGTLLALSISPVFYVGVALEHRPLAYWMSLAAYLGAALTGYGAVYRVLGGDGLEILAVLMFAAFAAGCGGAVGFLLDRVIATETTQLWMVRVALATAVLGSLGWSVMDAFTFEERRLSWNEARRSHGQLKGPGDANTSARVEAPLPLACLGYASADGAIRRFSESECTQKLGGRYFPNGECVKDQGGSYSWDLRTMNQRCPALGLAPDSPAHRSTP